MKKLILLLVLFGMFSSSNLNFAQVQFDTTSVKIMLTEVGEQVQNKKNNKYFNYVFYFEKGAEITNDNQKVITAKSFDIKKYEISDIKKDAGFDIYSVIVEINDQESFFQVFEIKEQEIVFYLTVSFLTKEGSPVNLGDFVFIN